MQFWKRKNYEQLEPNNVKEGKTEGKDIMRRYFTQHDPKEILPWNLPEATQDLLQDKDFRKESVFSELEEKYKEKMHKISEYSKYIDDYYKRYLSDKHYKKGVNEVFESDRKEEILCRVSGHASFLPV